MNRRIDRLLRSTVLTAIGFAIVGLWVTVGYYALVLAKHFFDNAFIGIGVFLFLNIVFLIHSFSDI